MMNDQQSLERSLSAQQPGFGIKVDRQQRRWHQRLVLSVSLLVSTSLLLFLVIEARGNAPTAPYTQQTAHATPGNPHTPQQTPTTQPSPTPQTALIVPQIDSLLTNKTTHQQFSGSVLIAQRGQVLLSKGYGMADWDHRVPNTAHTRFYLGSTTKQFTAMAILILQQRGKLNVRDRLCSYLAHCPAAWQPETIHELLTHTSGIPQLDDSELSDNSPEAWIASYNAVHLAFAPGSRYNYCSVCYQILGYVVERASGDSYSDFLEQSIFNPLQDRLYTHHVNASVSKDDLIR